MAFTFGQTTQAQSTPSLFGTPAVSGTTSLFGNTAKTTTAPPFGFGTTTNTGTSGTGFGGFGGFGTNTSSGTGTGAFGTGTGAFGTGTGTFGTGTGTFGTGTGSFGTGTGAFGTGTGAFGTGTSSLGTGGAGLFGGQQQQQQQQQQIEQQQSVNALSNIVTAVSMPQIFNDERDMLVAKWNQLQAFWGTGKAYYSQNGMMELKPDNPFCRFKAIGYSLMPKAKNEDGLVSLIIKQKDEDVKKVQQQFIDALHKILGSKPTLSICVEGVRPLPDDQTEMIVYVLERPPVGPSKRLTASDVSNFMNSNNIQTQIQNQLKIESVLPKTGLNPDTLKQYLDNPPSGIDPLLWNQAKLDNPDPENLIPVPMIAFKELHLRLKHQDQQTKLHTNRLDVISTDLADLQRNHSNMLAKLEEYKRKQLELGHRVLQYNKASIAMAKIIVEEYKLLQSKLARPLTQRPVIAYKKNKSSKDILVVVKQEIYRKLGYGIQADEEQLRVQLEASQAELNHPTQFKGRLNELMSQIRMQNQLGMSKSDLSYQMDPSLQQEIRQLLRHQQEGLQHLIQIIKEDADDIKLIEQGLSDSRR